MTINYKNYPQRKNYTKINFGCDTEIQLKNTPDASLLNAKEIIDNVFKLVNKIQFVSDILGENGKTVKPMLAKLGDATVYIEMDKTLKDKIKINLFSDTDDAMYKYVPDLLAYILVENPEKQRQSLNIVVNKKDKRMMEGFLNIFDCKMSFVRDTTTGKR